MSTCLALAVLVLAPQQAKSAYYAVPVDELPLASAQVLPSYGGAAPWEGWDAGVESLPWAALEGDGEVFVQLDEQPGDRQGGTRPHPLGVLCARASAARELEGTLFLPKVNGAGFLRLAFRLPAARATASEAEFRAADLQHVQRLMRLRLPGGAWFRHRHDELRAALGPDAPPATEPEDWFLQSDFRQPADALELFSGGRALYENLQLERGLPASAEAEATVALESLPGITVRAFDWKPLLAGGETAFDPLAGLIPADQHAVFFPSFQAFVDVLDEAERLGEFGLGAFERRSADAGTRARLERQLCLELDGFARALGPLAIESVALTGSDPYLRSGSDVALLFRTKDAHALHAFLARRQEAAAPDLEAEYGGMGVGTSRSHPSTSSFAGGGFCAVVTPTRSISSYVCMVRDVVVVTNSRVQFERIVETGGGRTPALEVQDEYRYFRQRYPLRDPLGEAGESALLVLPDAAIRRWCSPRWRIGAARRMRAAAGLAELHAAHVAELLEGVELELGVDPRLPELGSLGLSADGIHSPTHGTLDFLTPVAELPLERVTEREAALYRTWREGYEHAWSNFFDPVGARLSVSEKRTALDLTVLPLILGTEYSELREASRGAGLEEGSGDPHPGTLVHFVMAVNPDWEALKSVGSTLGAMGEKLGADPLSWLGGWLAIYADEGAFWDDLLQAEDVEEALRTAEADLDQAPLAVVFAVRSPLKLALFLTSLRAMVEGTAPGMTDWRERVVGERRFVEVGSPGLGEQFSLFYATTPSALILSVHEPTLLAAMQREELRRAGTPAASSPWTGAHAGLVLERRGFELLEVLLEGEIATALRRDSFGNLPILNEWRRLHPERDPVAVHEQVFHERLTCPGGGAYYWNADWRTMESSVFGNPGAPKPGIRRPRAWSDLAVARFALEFEHDGLRIRAEIERE